MICGVSDWCILYALFARVSSVWRDLSVKRSFFVTTSEFCRGTVTRAPESRPSSGAGRPCRISGSRSGSSARFAVRRGSCCCQPADCGVFTSGNFCRDAVTRAPESRPPSGAGRPCRISGSRSGSSSRPLCRPARKSLLPAFRPRRFHRRELLPRRGYASA